MEQAAGRLLLNFCRGSRTQGWVSATEAGLNAAEVTVLDLAWYIVPGTVQIP